MADGMLCCGDSWKRDLLGAVGLAPLLANIVRRRLAIDDDIRAGRALGKESARQLVVCVSMDDVVETTGETHQVLAQRSR